MFDILLPNPQSFTPRVTQHTGWCQGKDLSAERRCFTHTMKTSVHCAEDNSHKRDTIIQSKECRNNIQVSNFQGHRTSLDSFSFYSHPSTWWWKNPVCVYSWENVLWFSHNVHWYALNEAPVNTFTCALRNTSRSRKHPLEFPVWLPSRLIPRVQPSDTVWDDVCWNGKVDDVNTHFSPVTPAHVMNASENSDVLLMYLNVPRAALGTASAPLPGKQ